MKLEKRIVIIDSGFVGSSAVSFFAAKDLEADVDEKNATIKSRARQVIVDCFTFDRDTEFLLLLFQGKSRQKNVLKVLKSKG